MPALLAACASTRVTAPPPPPAPAQFKEAGPAAPTPVPDDWWVLFNDPVLNELQQRLVVGNEDLKTTLARVANARASLEASRSATQPTLSADLGGTRSGGGQVKTASSLSLGITAGWEIDLWGRLSMAAEGAQATLQANLDDLAAVRLSAQATLAQTYFSLRAAGVQQALLERTVAAWQRSLELTQTRYQAGVAARSDVLQAQVQLKSAQASLLESASQRAQDEHAIAVLLGVAPAALDLARDADRLPAPPAVPALLPSRLIERRPDIAAAERRVAAAYAQIGVTDAAFFPTLDLSASAGTRGSLLSDLLSLPNRVWSLGPALTASLFDGGQRRLASAQARATADQLGATYRQTVLSSLQEVEDNLVLARHLADEAALQEEALQAARQNLQITLDQYRSGTVSYLNVSTAQASALNSESTLIGLRSRQLAAINQLLKNVAGRWE